MTLDCEFSGEEVLSENSPTGFSTDLLPSGILTQLNAAAEKAEKFIREANSQPNGIPRSK